MDDTAILRVKNLSTSFFNNGKLQPIIHNVSFELYPGEMLALVGESGSGKSVTSLSIMGLIHPSAGRVTGGEIIYMGKNLLKMSKAELRSVRGCEISMVFQDPMTSLNPSFTVGNQMIETIHAHEKISAKGAYEKAISYLEATRLPDPMRIMRSYPFELSGGMRQRIMIAIALICNPKIIIADEPTTALDPTVQAQILDLFSELKTKFNTAVIFITHDFGIVANYADRVAVIYAGLIVECGSREDVLHRYGNPYTKALLNSIPQMNESRDRLTTIDGMPPDLRNLPIGCNFADRCIERMGKCIEQKPPLFCVGEQHCSACWLAEKEMTHV
jgi:oligopeptide/dipeptide ABC transporter ATP-binding protein